MDLPKPIVSTDWLAARYDDERVRVIDGSWLLDGGAKVPKAAFLKAHIPGAQFFDIDDIADAKQPLPHMAPTPQHFAEAVGGLGVSTNDHVVVYDQIGIFSSPRVWWTFRLMGHEQVSVLDGGLPKWMREDRQTGSGAPIATPKAYEPRPQFSLLANAAQIRHGRAGAVVIDARPGERFRGAAREPRSGLRSGAMPGAINVPIDAVISKDGLLKDTAALESAFGGEEVLRRPVVTTCGSGVTAATLALALETLGHRQWRLYDGSWSEWGRESNDPLAFPVVAGKDLRA